MFFFLIFIHKLADSTAEAEELHEARGQRLPINWFSLEQANHYFEH
jgi:hypothetical protein